MQVVITSGTLSPIDLYPRILAFNPVSVQSFSMTLTRDCMCRVVVTRGADQVSWGERGGVDRGWEGVGRGCLVWERVWIVCKIDKGLGEESRKLRLSLLIFVLH